jgi:bifunctional DNA-binding transcriptional regulator/antitoxin component of YhaV-PrlF toxin-antitoxin module
VRELFLKEGYRLHLPREAREALSIKAGDKVEFKVIRPGVFVLKRADQKASPKKA